MMIVVSFFSNWLELARSNNAEILGAQMTRQIWVMLLPIAKWKYFITEWQKFTFITFCSLRQHCGGPDVILRQNSGGHVLFKDAVRIIDVKPWGVAYGGTTIIIQ